MNEQEARSIVNRALENENGFLPETESKKLLSSYGIPVNRAEQAESEEEAVNLAKRLGYPMVMKILSPDISHKSEAGGVITNLQTESEVREGYKHIIRAARAYKPDAKKLQGLLYSPW